MKAKPYVYVKFGGRNRAASPETEDQCTMSVEDYYFSARDAFVSATRELRTSHESRWYMVDAYAWKLKNRRL